MGHHASHLHQLVRLCAWARAGRTAAPQPAPEANYTRSCAAIGGGHYPRVLAEAPGARLYRVRKLCSEGEFATVTQALAQWNADKRAAPGQARAIIEIADSATYHEAPVIRLAAGEQLQLRAASMVRPLLRVFEFESSAPERIVIAGQAGSCLTIEGVVLAGGPLAVEAAIAPSAGVPFELLLRHCTLVPGWETERQGSVPWSGRPSVLLGAGDVRLRVDHCIVGPLRCEGGPATMLELCDSVVDASHADGLAIADHAWGAAAVCASVARCTIIGAVQVEHLALAENAIFLGSLLVGRRDLGSLRHCHLPAGSRTPPRLRCHVGQAPHFCSLRYGTPDYAKLAPDSASAMIGVADDGGEPGAFHDLHCAPLVLPARAP